MTKKKSIVEQVKTMLHPPVEGVKDGVLTDPVTGYKMAEPCTCLRPATPEDMTSGKLACGEQPTRIVNVPEGNFRKVTPGPYIPTKDCKMCHGHGYRPRRAGGYDD